MHIRQTILRDLTRRLQQVRGIDPSGPEKLESYILAAPLSSLFRINPNVLAEALVMDAHDTRKLCIAAAKVDIFSLEWNLVCPRCGGVDHHDHLQDLNGKTHFCILCQQGVPLDLGSDVEVGFSISPSLLSEAYDPFASLETYFSYYYSSSLVRPPEIQKLIQSWVKSFFVLNSGESKRVSFNTLGPGDYYRVASLDAQQIFHLRVEGTSPAKDATIYDLESGTDGLSFSEATVEPGIVKIQLKNTRSVPTGFLILKHDDQVAQSVFQQFKVEFKPLFTGKDLLHNQTFRDLFKAEDLPPNLQINAGNVTILFTDLKGSTELYEKTGDLSAYSLVQQHFDLLKDVVDRYDGALIKTIGDAIMAAFSSRENGLRAAIDMVGAIRAMNKEVASEGHDIAIKVGIHGGEALAVNANDKLDYFGQTVNVAARVQGLAAGGEIWITEGMFTDPAVRDLVESQGLRAIRHLARLKGVQNETPVYQILGGQL